MRIKRRIFFISAVSIGMVCALLCAFKNHMYEVKWIKSDELRQPEGEHVIDADSAFQFINQDLFGEQAIQWLDATVKEEIYLYSEEIKGEFTEAQSEENRFSPELIRELEKMIYQSLDSSLHKSSWEEIQESVYFETIEKFGATDFTLNLEDMRTLFPELKNGETENVYEAYKLVSDDPNCQEMFRYVSEEKEYYVFVVGTGGSAGITNVRLTQKINDDFVLVSEFDTQNSGYGRVIQFKNDFYYIFLEYNYNLKNYDGVRIYELGNQENLKIKYLPYNYLWKNIYCTSEGKKLDVYIEGLKENIEDYIESGSVGDVEVFYGDEKEDKNFVVPEKEEGYFNNEYYKMDFANIGIPIYMRKSNLIPSSYRDVWHVRSSFYIQNPKSGVIYELENLEVGKFAPVAGEIFLVQFWFKEVEDKVYTFCLYHVSDYSYVLNVFRLQGEDINRVRTEAICPERKFVLG